MSLNNTGLTVIPQKNDLYSQDIYFQEALHELKNSIGKEELESYLSKRASIILKPESFVGRKADECINFLIRKGFTPVAFQKFEFNRSLIRDLWRFQLNAATPERLSLLDQWGKTSEVMFVILKDNDDNTEGSAANKLTFIKGHSNPIYHKEGELRHKLSQDIPMLNYIHSSDETADFVRDFGVCFDSQQRLSLITDMKNDIDLKEELLDEINSIYNNKPLYIPIYQNAVNDLMDVLKHQETQNKVQRLEQNIKDGISKILGGDLTNIESMIDLLNKNGIEIEEWTKITLLAKHIKLTHEGQRGMIPSIIAYKTQNK